MAAEGPSRRLLIGRIAGAHGVRGEVLIHAYTSAPQDIAAYGALSDAAAKRSFDIRIVRTTTKGVVARIAGIADRSAAEALKGVDLYVARDRLPAAGEDEFYHADLVGLAAVDPAGKAIGEIVAVQNYGAGDLLELRLPGSARTELVPFTQAVVPEIDIAARRAVVIMPATTDAREERGPERAD